MDANIRRRNNVNISSTNESSPAYENESSENAAGHDGSSQNFVRTSQNKIHQPSSLAAAGAAPKSKYTNWWIRLSTTFLIFAIIYGVLYYGPTACVLTVLFIQLNSFHEIISIGYRIYKLYELPRFRSLSWYFLVCINYYFYGELIQDHLVNLPLFRRESPVLSFILNKHGFITYFMFLMGFLGFVLSLRKNYYAKQFFFFGWTIVSLLFVVAVSHLFISNLMHGMVWVIMPSALVTVNDSMAYICGFFWPWKKTPLIALSPKKTWEGFLGGAFFTLLVGWFLSAWIAQQEYYICPVEVNQDFFFTVRENCVPDDIYKVQEIAEVPTIFGSSILKTILGRQVIKMRWFQVHSCAIALFASILGPFGGFFASGLKRGFKIKDFGDSIPGHGGFLDRFDCHYMVGTFTCVYLATFVNVANVNKILHLVNRMGTDLRKELFLKLAVMMRGVFSAEEIEAIRASLAQA